MDVMGPILACADTNAATDNLVEGLVERGINVTRLGQPAKVCVSLRHGWCAWQMLCSSPQGLFCCLRATMLTYPGLHSWWDDWGR